MQTIKVESLLSPKSGRPVANQFVIWSHNKEYFQSYNSIIAVIDHNTPENEVTLDENYWNYSRTTSKYRNEFLGEDTKTTKEKIANGTYKLADLN